MSSHIKTCTSVPFSINVRSISWILLCSQILFYELSFFHLSQWTGVFLLALFCLNFSHIISIAFNSGFSTGKINNSMLNDSVENSSAIFRILHYCYGNIARDCTKILFLTFFVLHLRMHSSRGPPHLEITSENHSFFHGVTEYLS